MIILRKARIQDAELLKYWDKQEHVIASDPNDDWDWDWDKELSKKHSWREQYIGELDGRAIGFLQIIDPKKEETHYWGKDIEANLRAIDIWIGEQSDLGKGFGTQMMTIAINKCFEDKKIRSIIIDPLESNIKAHKFYRSLGFTFKEKRRMNLDECFVFELTKDNWKNNTTQNKVQNGHSR